SEIADIAILNNNGSPLYIRDIAFVSDGLSELSSISRVSLDGKPSQNALSFNVLKQAGGNITDITTSVNERLKELQEPGEILEGMDVLIIFDTGEYLVQDLTNLTSSGVLAVIL